MIKGWRNRIIFSVISTMVIVMLVGCQSKETKEPSLGVSLYKSDDLFISVLEKELKLYSKDKIATSVYNAANSQKTQTEQINTMLSKGMNVLAINLVDTKQAQEVVDFCKKKNKAVIFFNREPEKSVIESYERCWYIGTDSVEAGVLQGNIILEGWFANPSWDKNGDGVIQYVMLQGEEGHTDTMLRSSLVIQMIESADIEVECLAKDFANWDSIEGQGLMDQWINDYKDRIEVVISNNDAMAIGAIVALQKKGYLTKDRFIPIVGVDGLPEFLNKIKSGLAIGTVVNDAKSQSAVIIDSSLNIIEGEDAFKGSEWQQEEERIIRIPYIPITSANVDDYIE